MKERKPLACNYCKKDERYFKDTIVGSLGIGTCWILLSNPKIDILLCELCMEKWSEIEQILISEIEKQID